MSQFSVGPGLLVTLQDAQTTGNGHVVSPSPSIKRHTVYIKGNGAIGAGAIQIETASDPSYSGTWAPVGGGPISVVASSEVIAEFEGSYAALRARISTTVTTTTVTVKYRGI